MSKAKTKPAETFDETDESLEGFPCRAGFAPDVTDDAGARASHADESDGWRPSEYNGATVVIGPRIQGSCTLRFILPPERTERLLALAGQHFETLQTVVTERVAESPQAAALQHIRAKIDAADMQVEHLQHQAAALETERSSSVETADLDGLVDLAGKIDAAQAQVQTAVAARGLLIAERERCQKALEDAAARIAEETRAEAERDVAALVKSLGNVAERIGKTLSELAVAVTHQVQIGHTATTSRLSLVALRDSSKVVNNGE